MKIHQLLLRKTLTEIPAAWEFKAAEVYGDRIIVYFIEHENNQVFVKPAKDWVQLLRKYSADVPLVVPENMDVLAILRAGTSVEVLVRGRYEHRTA